MGLTKKRKAELDADAYAMFARIYPHEAHAENPERFWRHFQQQRPGVSRAEMVRMLRETQEQRHADAD